MTAPLLFWLLAEPDIIPPQRVPTRVAEPTEHHDGRGEIVGFAFAHGAGMATHHEPTAVEYEQARAYSHTLAIREREIAADDELLLILGLL